eukprot:513427_1
MALANSQLNPLVLRGRSIPRHTEQSIPHINDINSHIENYINTIKNQVSSLSFKQQIHYWSSKVSESVHVCIDILLPEFDNFTNIVILRWLIIGYALYQLTQLWKTHKNNIKTHTRIDKWLPHIVKQKLPPNLIPRGKYHQLRKYIIMWENRDLITKLPKLRGESTHRLNEMQQWIREFNRNVALIASQRNMSIPNDINQQMDLYKIWLAHHSKCVSNDNEHNEHNECKTLDSIISEYLPGINDYDSGNNESKNNEQNAMELSDNEQVKPKKKISKKDALILKYRQKIKELKKELSDTKDILKITKYKHCQAIRERYIYKELHNEHKDEMDGLHELINKKNIELQHLKQDNIQLQNALIGCKDFINKLRKRFVEYEKMIERFSNDASSSGSCESFNGILPENTEGFYDENCADISDNRVDIEAAGSCFYKNFFRNYKRKREGMKQKFKKVKRNCNKRDNVMSAAMNRNGNCYLSSDENGGRNIRGSRRSVNELRKYVIGLRKENGKLKNQYNAIVVKLNEINGKKRNG